MNILAIESSCDETAAAVVQNGTKILSTVIATSHEMHEKYGGIVPEVAARKQLEFIIPVITEALIQAFPKSDKTASDSSYYLSLITAHIDAIAVTVGPGLIGSLLVGVETAKTIAMVSKKPIIPVNHVLAHQYANFIEQTRVIANPKGEAIPSGSPLHQSADRDDITFPTISLVVSGGHTELYLMKNMKDLTWLGGTIDDAAGECFDKSARLLGFGHGGGLAIQEAATKYQVSGIKYQAKLPRPMLDKDNELNFSFSGLKTAILREVNILKETNAYNEEKIHALSYEIQETITDVLVKKTLRAVEKFDATSILLSGGVASNLRLREKFLSTLQTLNSSLSLHAPPVALCTDNAAYIGSYAFFRGKPEDWRTLTAIPDLSVEKTR
jgi:N6-L-threonylcarbamoyladenine synthase